MHTSPRLFRITGNCGSKLKGQERSRRSEGERSVADQLFPLFVLLTNCCWVAVELQANGVWSISQGEIEEIVRETG